MSLRALPFKRGRFDWLFGSAAGLGIGLLGSLCLLAAAVALAGTAWHAWTLHLTLADRQQRLATHVPAPAAASSSATAAGPKLRAAERARLNLIVRRLNTPWGAIFDALERGSSAAVTVLAVEPDIERGAIRIQTEGRVLDELLRHAGSMSHNPRFTHVQLLRIETGEAGAPRLPRLTFDLALAP